MDNFKLVIFRLNHFLSTSKYYAFSVLVSLTYPFLCKDRTTHLEQIFTDTDLTDFENFNLTNTDFENKITYQCRLYAFYRFLPKPILPHVLKGHV